MKFIQTELAIIYLATLSFSLPVIREVPQEHSHEPILTVVRASLALNNPNNITDPVFGLLGDAGAASGAGNITDVTCLQQAIADQAFSNAKAIRDVRGQVNALIFRALERNSGKVGLATESCISIKAVNPEIAAIQQHQDPASTNATAINKAITLELARQIHSVGGNPLSAIQAGTFAPGRLDDPTAKGNTCDDANDAAGCIFTQKLLVPDATPEEIQAAILSTMSHSSAASSSPSPSQPTATGSASMPSDGDIRGSTEKHNGTKGNNYIASRDSHHSRMTGPWTDYHIIPLR